MTETLALFKGDYMGLLNTKCTINIEEIEEASLSEVNFFQFLKSWLYLGLGTIVGLFRVPLLLLTIVLNCLEIVLHPVKYGFVKLRNLLM